DQRGRQWPSSAMAEDRNKQAHRTSGRTARMLAPYIPILALFIIAAAFAAGSVLIAPLVGPRRYNRAKLEPYECGIEPTPQSAGAHRFPVKFYLTAMLF